MITFTKKRWNVLLLHIMMMTFAKKKVKCRAFSTISSFSSLSPCFQAIFWSYRNSSSTPSTLLHELQHHNIANLIAAFVTIVGYSTSKYLTYKTSFQRTTLHEEMVLYPSISFCKKWTYDHYIDEQILNENISFTEIRDQIKSEVWSRSQVVHFLR